MLHMQWCVQTIDIRVFSGSDRAARVQEKWLEERKRFLSYDLSSMPLAKLQQLLDENANIRFTISQIRKIKQNCGETS